MVVGKTPQKIVKMTKNIIFSLEKNPSKYFSDHSFIFKRMLAKLATPQHMQ
jgi:hypothetical protein